MLEDWGKLVVEAAQRNIGSTRRINGKNRRTDSSGRLRNSLEFKVTDGVVEFIAEDYGLFVEEGVKGLQATPLSAKDSPFRFKIPLGNARNRKSPRVVSPFQKQIKEWMKKKPIPLRSKDGRFIKQTESNKNSAAYMIARSIRRKGLEGIHFYEDAINSVPLEDHIIDIIEKELEI